MRNYWNCKFERLVKTVDFDCYIFVWEGKRKGERWDEMKEEDAVIAVGKWYMCCRHYLRYNSFFSIILPSKCISEQIFSRFALQMFAQTGFFHAGPEPSCNRLRPHEKWDYEELLFFLFANWCKCFILAFWYVLYQCWYPECRQRQECTAYFCSVLEICFDLGESFFFHLLMCISSAGVPVWVECRTSLVSPTDFRLAVQWELGGGWGGGGCQSDWLSIFEHWWPKRGDIFCWNYCWCVFFFRLELCVSTVLIVWIEPTQRSSCLASMRWVTR